MAWIESHQELGRHPKMFRLAARARACRPQIIGHLHYLWWWAMDFAPDGDVSHFTHDEIAAASNWNGDATLWLAALKETGWIDPSGHLHDWHDYAGKLIDYRARDAERKRASRAVHRTSAVTVPNPTVPNQTPTPSPPPAAAGEGRGQVPGDDDHGFAAFWNAYPRKAKRRDAHALWRKLLPPLDQCLAAIDQQKRSHQWQKDHGQFIPYPVSWLKSAQWQDTPKITLKPAPKPPATQPDPEAWPAWLAENYPDKSTTPYAQAPESVRAEFRRSTPRSS